MDAINRPHTPDPEIAEFLYRAYLLFRSAPPAFNKWQRQGAFESIAMTADSWRVIGISEEALREIGKTGVTKETQRGHWFAREQRSEMLFGQNTEVLDQNNLMDFFFRHDTTVVITKGQNNARGDHSKWGRIIPVPEGMFLPRGYSFSLRKRVEVPWIAAQIAILDGEIKDQV